MNSARRTIAAAAWLLLVAACGGESSDQATATCQQAQQRQSQCFDQSALDRCVSCYEQCGSACIEVAGSCPLQFNCK